MGCEGYMFKEYHMKYIIETSPHKWTVIRKDNHFERLRSQLLKMYPERAVKYIQIPSLKLLKNVKDDKYIDSNQLMAQVSLKQNFLTEVINHPILRASQEVELFLSIPLENFEQEFSNLEKVLAPSLIEEHKNHDGIVYIYLGTSYINK